MFVEVVVSDHSLDAEGFTYFVPDFLVGKFGIGSVLEVPFADELENGVVVRMDVPPPERTEAKSASGIAVAASILSECQIRTARDMAVRYFVRLDQTISFFLPKPVLKRFVKLWKDRPFIETPPSVAEAVHPKPTLVYDREGKGAAKLFGDRFPAEPGTVLILPSEAAVWKFMRDTSVPKEDFLVHSEKMTEAVDFRFRVSVMEKERPFLVWTRKLCTYNLAAYRKIVYFEDQLFPEARHRFFHSYNHIRILESMVENGGPPFTISSYLPQVATMAKTMTGAYLFENA